MDRRMDARLIAISPNLAVGGFLKGIRVIEWTSFPLLSRFKGDNSKGQQGGATILARDTASWPDIYVYQLSSNISKGISVIERTNFPL